MSKVLVTGGAGRLGRSAVAHLHDRGDEVVGCDLAAPGDVGVPWVTADLTDPRTATETIASVQPDVIVHLAAIAVPFSAPETTILHTNTALAYNVHAAAVEAGVGTVITASSPTVIGYGAPTGWEPSYLPIDEDHPPRPWNAYSLSKVVAEQVVRTFAAQVGDRLRLASFRPCYVISPEEWGGAPTQQGHTVRERIDDPALGAPSLFNYLDARDAAAFLARLIDAAGDIPNGEVFFASAADSLTRGPVAELLPRFHPGTAGYLDGFEPSAPVFSAEKAGRLLGWEPQRSWRSELT